jgi:hypothetical protein
MTVRLPPAKEDEILPILDRWKQISISSVVVKWEAHVDPFDRGSERSAGRRVCGATRQRFPISSARAAINATSAVLHRCKQRDHRLPPWDWAPSF